MSLQRVQLWKVIRLLGMNRKEQLSMLRPDARQTVAKEVMVEKQKGFDFYGPLWHDIKAHTLRGTGLVELTALRVRADKNCRRIYYAARDGYLVLYPQIRALFNGPIQSVTGEYAGSIDIGGCSVRTENFMSLQAAAGTTFHFYPYLFVEPSLSATCADYGLSILQKTVGTRSKGRIGILDVVRSKAWYSDEERDYSGSYSEASEKIGRLQNMWLELVEEYRKKAA